MTTPHFLCRFDEARWSRQADGVRFRAEAGADSVDIVVTRAGLAALAAKDRSEVAAEEALSLLRSNEILVAKIVGTAWERAGGSEIVIDYAEVEKAL